MPKRKSSTKPKELTGKFAKIPSPILAMRSDDRKKKLAPRGNTANPKPGNDEAEAEEKLTALLPALAPNDLRVYAVIADVGVHKGFRAITRREIAKRSGLTRAQISVAIKSLINLGLIEAFETHAKLRQFDRYVLTEFDDKEGWVKVPREWVRNAEVSAPEFATLVHLLDHRNARTKVCRPSAARLAELTGAGVRSIKTHLAKLTKLGLIARVQQGENRAAQTWFAHLNAREFAAAVAGKPVRFTERFAEDAIPADQGEPVEADLTNAPTRQELAELAGSYEKAPPLGDADAPPLNGNEQVADMGFSGFHREFDETERAVA